MADKLKLTLAILILSFAIGAFYYYGDQSLLIRVVGLIIATAISLVVTMQTAQGRNAWVFLQEAQQEVRKVVWPTRKETIQTTLIVMVMVILIALFLWGVDVVLVWAVRLLTGQGE